MKKRQEPGSRFAICIKTDDPDLLTPRMIYEILPDENAARSNYIRVIDNEGEDYLYPANQFILIGFPQAVERALLNVSHPFSPSAAIGNKRRVVSTLTRKVKPSAA